jgi:type II secretory pathway pseudopilin PulG
MCKRKRCRGLTMIEVLLLIGIFSCVIIMLLPAILAARESARKATCLDNMKQLGLACRGYDTAYKRLVASSGVTRDADGKIVAVDGWSWLVLVSPYLESGKGTGGVSVGPKDLYDRLDIANGRPLIEPDGAKGTPHADVLATAFPGLLCPSSGCSPYTEFGGTKAAITNYKPLGATHIESLSVASANPLTPKFDSVPRGDTGPGNPDGNCFPGTNLSDGVMRNGLSNTLWLVESLEQRHARWTVGADAAVVALPRDVEFEEYQSGIYGLKGYGKALKGSPEADSTYWAYHTYIDWDYSQSPYDAADGSQGERYGPSSNHPGVAHHLFMDGSSRSLRRDIDLALYMFLIRGRFRGW